MNSLRELQHEFLDYLLDDTELDIVERIQSTPRRSAKQRMTFYANAYRMRLQEALNIDYERLHGYLGDDLFATLMQQYIDNYPSHHPSLRHFGQHLIELVEAMEPFNRYPEIAEITHIEQAFANSFDAADSDSVSLNQLAQLQPDAWATLTLRFHAAVQLLPQQYNSFQMWKALSNEETPPEKKIDESTWLIWRQELVSRYRALENAEYAALKVAMSAGSFADVCAALMEYLDEHEIPQRAVGYLQQWINDQIICELSY